MPSTLRVLAILLIVSRSVLACPLCHTETGQQVRAGIFGSGFAFYLLMMILPFIVFLAITALIYFGFSIPGERARIPVQQDETL